MHKKIAISRVFVCVLLLLLTASLVVSFVAPSLAYFQTIFTSTGINSAKVELIFDRLNFQSENVLNAKDEAGNARFSATAEWGSEKNPYVISAKHHVQNLSVLQNTGFFDKATQAYFLVCTPEGTPVAINCEGMTMAPVGTHANPFTGVIDGAFATSAAEVTYTYTPRSSSDTVAEKSYGVSVSTIGNLIVKASTSEPDIGFFGCVGYYGTPTVDPETNDPAVDGYAASIHNLLLADVTVSSVPTLKDSLAAWWAQVKATIQAEEGKEAPEHRHEDFESHHIGVVAGHADFATINNVSVFYTQGVQTFQISGSSYINYYSTTGLIGTLHYVNPTITSSGLLVGDGNSISDSDMVEVGLGGGGAISGTLTGYMMAETLFSQHEQYLTMQSSTTKNRYNVSEMKKADGTQLFETVTMLEGRGNTKDEVTYYYFKDTVFTFAMSSSSANQKAGLIDYVQKLWVLDDASQGPVLYGTNERDDWQLTVDPNASVRVAYKLEAVTDPEEMTSGSYYVLAYYDKTSDKTYIFDVNSSSSGYCVELSEDSIFNAMNEGLSETEAAAYAPSKFGDGSYEKVWLTSSSAQYFAYSFIYKPTYDTTATIASPLAGQYRFGVHLERNLAEILGSTLPYTFKDPPTVPALSNGQDANGGLLNTAVHLFKNTWTFTNSYSTTVNNETTTTTLPHGKMVVYNAISEEHRGLLGTYSLYAYYRFKFSATSTSGQFAFDRNFSRSDNTIDDSAADYTTWTENNYFNVYKIEPNDVDDTGKLVTDPGDGNVVLTPTNLRPTLKDDDGNPSYDEDGKLLLDTEYSFDPSKYVFENRGDGTYKLAPIASYNLNSGRGTKVEQLNHIVKMAQATPASFQFEIGWDLGQLDDWLNQYVSTSSGGVVSAQIGTTDKVYAIPAGMIAFYIDETITTADNPSYINIIVAVNPEQTLDSKVGLWDTSQFGTSSSVNFDLSKPTYSFALPKSITGSSSSDKQYAIEVSEYLYPKLNGTTPDLDANGKTAYETDSSTSYVYLGGETAFVYHSFEVTKGGIYLLGSCAGPFSVAYFSVSGAAGQGADGTSTSPLGDIDFVYAYGGNIISIDQKFDGVQIPDDETYSYYYPSYHFIVMKGNGDSKPFVQSESIKVHRYINTNDSMGTKRHIKIIGCTNAEAKGLSTMYQDDLEE